MAAPFRVATVQLAPGKLQNQRSSEPFAGLRRALFSENRMQNHAALACAFFWSLPHGMGHNSSFTFDSSEIEEERYGLELEEYEQMMVAADSTDLTAQQNQETRVVTELMRWTGMRVSDAHKFTDSEIVRNEKGNGWNADFIQKKTKRRCVSPLPEHVVEMLKALPGQMKDDKKYFFTSTYTALRGRIDTLAERAQKDKPFTHALARIAFDTMPSSGLCRVNLY